MKLSHHLENDTGTKAKHSSSDDEKPDVYSKEQLMDSSSGSDDSGGRK